MPGNEKDPQGSEGKFISRNKEDIRPTGFIVKAEGVSVLEHWLEFQESISQINPIIGIGIAINDLPLGTLEFQNGQLMALAAGATFSPEDSEFELNTMFYFRPSDDEHRIISPTSGIDILELFKRSNMRENPPVGIIDLERALKQTANFASKYIIEPDNEFEGDLRITPRDAVGENENASFALHQQSGGHPLPKYCLHVKGEKIDGGSQELPTKYQQLAELTEYVVYAICDSLNTPVPQKTFSIMPPKNLSAQMKTAEESIKIKKKMLTASGIIDGDEELAEEVRSKILVAERPTTTFADIGGNEPAKEELEALVDALRNPNSYKKWGTQAPRGVLMFGPPGTGKTLLAKALAHEADAQIMIVNTADVLHSLYGKAERLVRTVFEEANRIKPVVVLFDELDALAGSREHSTEVTSRIVSVLLQHLDGLKERDSGIIVIGTTNRLEVIDSALQRPGRFDMLIEVSLPEEPQRQEIFNIHIKNAIERAGGRELFDGSLDISQLMSTTKGFSGADIEEVIRRTLAKKVRQEMKDENPGPVTITEMIDTIQKYERVRKAKSQIGFQTS